MSSTTCRTLLRGARSIDANLHHNASLCRSAARPPPPPPPPCPRPSRDAASALAGPCPPSSPPFHLPRLPSLRQPAVLCTRPTDTPLPHAASTQPGIGPSHLPCCPFPLQHCRGLAFLQRLAPACSNCCSQEVGCRLLNSLRHHAGVARTLPPQLPSPPSHSIRRGAAHAALSTPAGQHNDTFCLLPPLLPLSPCAQAPVFPPLQASSSSNAGNAGCGLHAGGCWLRQQLWPAGTFCKVS